MPKSTFHNLNEEKKEKIFAAAVQEFARHRFSEASINQIVKNASISRGSFYQYFEDKEDLYLYVITKIGQEKLELFNQEELLHQDADFFETYMQMIKSALKWAKTKPLYNQIGMLMQLDNNDFIEKLRNLSAEGFTMVKELIERDKKRGLIRKDINTDLIVDIFYTLMMRFLMNYYRTGNYDEMFPMVEEINNIMKYGISVKQDQ